MTTIVLHGRKVVGGRAEGEMHWPVLVLRT